MNCIYCTFGTGIGVLIREHWDTGKVLIIIIIIGKVHFMESTLSWPTQKHYHSYSITLLYLRNYAKDSFSLVIVKESFIEICSCCYVRRREGE